MRNTNLNPGKKALIDFAARRFPIRSFVDLGGIWRVHGAYTFYTLQGVRPERAHLVDWQMPAEVCERAANYPTLLLEQGYFSDLSIRERIGRADAIFMFDVLLHQVDPDWADVFRTWAEIASYVLIYNPQWTQEKTVRLVDLGEKQYFDNVPHKTNEAPYTDLFDKLDVVHPIHARPWRDSLSIWQWGITDEDLISCAEAAGLKCCYFADWGRFDNLPHFDNHAFVFARS